MPETISLTKSNPLLPAEDFVALRKQGFKNIEKSGNNIWTNYNNSDPGITILDAVCYAITDLAYRTGFEIKDLLAPEKTSPDTWNQIFYTAKQILHNTPLTVNDYRKLIIDIKGVRNAWIEKSKDYEVPVYIDYNYPSQQKDSDCSCKNPQKKVCYGKLGLNAIDVKTYGLDLLNQLDEKLSTLNPNFTDDEKATFDGEVKYLEWQISRAAEAASNPASSKIAEFEGLYKVMVEYEESVLDKNERESIRQTVVEKLAANRSLCEDFISVDAIEYEDEGAGIFAVLEEYADPDVVLAQIFFTFYKYFTPSVHFYTIEQMLKKTHLINGELTPYRVDEIFEGPPLKHGFIDDDELEKTDLFRDIRLSDIINEIGSIQGIKAITYLHLPFNNVADNTSITDYFNEWIQDLAERRKIARIQPTMSRVMFCKERETITYNIDPKKDRRPDRMLKLFKELKSTEAKYKLIGVDTDFSVPAGECMNLEDYYPVTYSMPGCYGVGEEDNLPANADEKRKVQSLQLKGYMLFFEQILSDYLVRLNHLRDLFSFDDNIQHTAFIRALYTVKDCNETQLSEIRDLKALLIDHENRGEDHWDLILKDYTAVLQNLLETPKQFNKRRNIFLNHMLARFSEDLSEYEAISQWLTPYKVDERMVADKIRILKGGEYFKISTQRNKAYDYTKYDTWNSSNVSGAERRVSRLLGFADINCRKLTTDYVVVEASPNTPGKNIIKLLDPDNKEIVLLTSVEVSDGCCTELLINQILQYADERIYFKFGNGTSQKRRKYEETVEPFWFHLYDTANPDPDNDDSILLAKSKNFQSNDDRERAFKKLEALMKIINGNEGMHLIEHILLRPKLNEVFNLDDNNQNVPVPVSFLNVCLNKCDLIELNEKTDSPPYKKKITRTPPAICYDKMPWILEYINIDSNSNFFNQSILFQETFPDGSKALPLKFRTYEALVQRVLDLQEFGSEISNYKIIPNVSIENIGEVKSIADIKYCITIYGNNNAVLAQSNYIYLSTDEAQKEILNQEDPSHPGGLIPYFGFELDFYCQEDPCDNNEDPYSYRATVVLPCWPKRLRDATFRNFVEKTIQTEFPAHIHTRIAWVGLQEMQRFEEVYMNWLEEMAQNEMPRYEIVNPLVDKLNTLQPCTCDEDCSS